MSSMHLMGQSMPRFGGGNPRSPSARNRRSGIRRLHPVLQAAVWIVMGAGIGSALVVVGVWLLMRVPMFSRTFTPGVPVEVNQLHSH